MYAYIVAKVLLLVSNSYLTKFKSFLKFKIFSSNKRAMKGRKDNKKSEVSSEEKIIAYRKLSTSLEDCISFLKFRNYYIARTSL